MTEEQIRTGNAILNSIQDRKNLKHLAKKLLSPKGMCKSYISMDGSTEKLYMSPAITRKLYSMLEESYDLDIHRYEEEMERL